MGIYEMSVGRGANFLINIGPDRHGLLPEKDVQRLGEFGAMLKARYGQALPFGEVQRTAENEWSVEMEGFSTEWGKGDRCNALVNRIVISEDLTEGEGIEEFRVYAHMPAYKSKRVCLYKGDTVGHKAICVIPTMRTAKITVEVTKANGKVNIRDIKAYYAQ